MSIFRTHDRCRDIEMVLRGQVEDSRAAYETLYAQFVDLMERAFTRELELLDRLARGGLGPAPRAERPAVTSPAAAMPVLQRPAVPGPRPFPQPGMRAPLHTPSAAGFRPGQRLPAAGAVPATASSPTSNAAAAALAGTDRASE